jgi:hypothetical protein
MTSIVAVIGAGFHPSLLLYAAGLRLRRAKLGQAVVPVQDSGNGGWLGAGDHFSKVVAGK